MLFHVQMTVRLPHDMPAAQPPRLKARERAMAQELQRDGKWRHLWRIAGRYANVSVFDVAGQRGAARHADAAAAVPLHGDRGAAAVPPRLVDPDRRPLISHRPPFAPPTPRRHHHGNEMNQSATAGQRHSSRKRATAIRACETITQRIVGDLFRDDRRTRHRPDEFWAGVDWLTRLGATGQAGLITAGLGFDRLLDIRDDEADRNAPAATRARRAPSKGRCTSPARR